MKQSTFLVFVIVMLLKLLNTDAHFKPRHVDSSLSSPIGFQSTSGLPTFGQSSDLKTTLAVQKTIGFMTLLMTKPKLLCFIPPFLVVDFLTQLSCNPAVLNAVPHHLLTGFMSSLTAVPTLVNSIPPNLFVSISNQLSIGAPDGTAAGPVGSPNAELLPTPLPSSSVSANAAAVITPVSSPAAPTPGLPGVTITKEVTASISPAVPSSGPIPSLPGASITKEATASISPAVPSSGPIPSLPGATITKEITASIAPSPAAPVLPADLPTTDGIPPNAYPPAAPSVPCIEVPAVGSPPITLPSSLPIPSPSPLSFLSLLFNKGAGNSLLESKIESIVKLLSNVNLKLPQLHLPEIGSAAVPTKPVIHVKPEPSKVFILLPAPLLNKPEIPSTQATKLYYKPGSLNQILDFLHQRILTASQKLTIPKPNFSKLNLPKLNPVVPAQSNPIKCLPIFSKVPC